MLPQLDTSHVLTTLSASPHAHSTSQLPRHDGPCTYSHANENAESSAVQTQPALPGHAHAYRPNAALRQSRPEAASSEMHSLPNNRLTLLPRLFQHRLESRMRASDPLWRAMFAAQHNLRHATQRQGNEQTAVVQATKQSAALPTIVCVTQSCASTADTTHETMHTNSTTNTDACALHIIQTPPSPQPCKQTIDARVSHEVHDEDSEGAPAAKDMPTVNFRHLQLGPQPQLLTQITSPTVVLDAIRMRRSRVRRNSVPLARPPVQYPSSPSLSACRAAATVFRAMCSEFSKWEMQEREKAQSREVLARTRLMVSSLRELQEVLESTESATSVVTMADDEHEDVVVATEVAEPSADEAIMRVLGVARVDARASDASVGNGAEDDVMTQPRFPAQATAPAATSFSLSSSPHKCRDDGARGGADLAQIADSIVEDAVAAALQTRRARGCVRNRTSMNTNSALPDYSSPTQGETKHDTRCLPLAKETTTPHSVVAHTPMAAVAHTSVDTGEDQRSNCSGNANVQGEKNNHKDSNHVSLGAACRARFPALTFVLTAALCEASATANKASVVRPDAVAPFAHTSDITTAIAITRADELAECDCAQTRCGRGDCDFCSAVTTWIESRPVLMAMTSAMIDEATQSTDDA